jgi:hypothetical protein
MPEYVVRSLNNEKGPPTGRKSSHFRLYGHESRKVWPCILRWSLGTPLAVERKAKGGPCLHIFMMSLLSH